MWRAIEVLEQGGNLPETQGLDPQEHRWLLRELKQIMAVYADRCSAA